MGLVWICNLKISGDLYLLALFAALVCNLLSFFLSFLYLLCYTALGTGNFPLFSLFLRGGGVFTFGPLAVWVSFPGVNLVDCWLG